MGGQTQPESNQLLQELSGAVNSDQVTETLLARLRRDANRMMASQPHEAHIVLGAVYAAQGKLDSMHEHHRIALGHYPRSESGNLNYASSLLRVGRPLTALKYARAAYAISPTDETVVYVLLDTLVRSGHVNEAAKMAKKLRTQESFEFAQDIVSMSIKLPIFSDQMDDSRATITANIEAVLDERAIACKGITTDYLEGDDSISIIYKLDASTEAATEANFALAERLADAGLAVREAFDYFVCTFLGLRKDNADKNAAVA